MSEPEYFFSMLTAIFTGIGALISILAYIKRFPKDNHMRVLATQVEIHQERHAKITLTNPSKNPIIIKSVTVSPGKFPQKFLKRKPCSWEILYADDQIRENYISEYGYVAVWRQGGFSRKSSYLFRITTSAGKVHASYPELEYRSILREINSQPFLD